MSFLKKLFSRNTEPRQRVRIASNAGCPSPSTRTGAAFSGLSAKWTLVAHRPPPNGPDRGATGLQEFPSRLLRLGVAVRQSSQKPASREAL